MFKGDLGIRIREGGNDRVPNQRDVACIGVRHKVPAIRLRLGVVVASVEAVGGDFCVDLRRGIVVQQDIADCSATSVWV